MNSPSPVHPAAPRFSAIKLYGFSFLVADLRDLPLAVTELRLQRAAKKALEGEAFTEIVFLLSCKKADALVRVYTPDGNEDADPSLALLAAFGHIARKDKSASPKIECMNRVYRSKISDVRPYALAVEGQFKSLLPLLNRLRGFHPCRVMNAFYPVYPVLSEALCVTAFGDFSTTSDLKKALADRIIAEWSDRSPTVVFSEILLKNNLKITDTVPDITSDLSMINAAAAAAYSAVLSSEFDLDQYIRIVCGKERYRIKISISYSEERTAWMYTSVFFQDAPSKLKEISCLVKKEKRK